jgi:hypothetical protein
LEMGCFGYFGPNSTPLQLDDRNPIQDLKRQPFANSHRMAKLRPIVAQSRLPYQALEAQLPRPPTSRSRSIRCCVIPGVAILVIVWAPRWSCFVCSLPLVLPSWGSVLQVLGLAALEIGIVPVRVDSPEDPHHPSSLALAVCVLSCGRLIQCPLVLGITPSLGLEEESATPVLLDSRHAGLGLDGARRYRYCGGCELAVLPPACGVLWSRVAPQFLAFWVLGLAVKVHALGGADAAGFWLWPSGAGFSVSRSGGVSGAGVLRAGFEARGVRL